MAVRPAPWWGRRPPDAVTAPEVVDPSSRRRELLDVLHDAPAPMGVTELAHALGVHPNTVRFHLDTLVERGQVERVRGTRHRPGRPPTLFRVVPAMDPDGPRRFLTLADVLVSDLASSADAEARAIAAGRRWGEHLPAPSVPAPRRGRHDPAAEQAHARQQLGAVLDELGFAPDLRDDAADAAAPAVIELRHCPFLELATEQPGVVCAVHLGMLRGALDAWGAPITVDRLEPFVTPDLCRAHVTPSAQAEGPA